MPYYDLKTMEDVKVLAEKLNTIGEVAKSYKMKVLYHNHAHEFVKDGDAYLLDRLFDEVEAGNLYQEPDLYWVAYAGVDPLAYLEKVKDRSPNCSSKTDGKYGDQEKCNSRCRIY